MARMDLSQYSADSIVVAGAAAADAAPARPRSTATLYLDAADGSANCYVSLGRVATLANYTVKLLPGDYYETPAGFSGRISVIWDAAGAVVGNLRVTELA
jgi:hypothetical protein